MDNLSIVCIAFVSIIALTMAVAFIMATHCKKWHNAYMRLKETYEKTKSENIKLQHEVYRLHYRLPSVDKKKKGE